MFIPIIALLATVSFAAPSVTTSQQVVSITESPILANTPQSLEEYVHTYFKDDPVLAEIARCESRYRHLNKSGEILRGEVNALDIGVMQINTHYHEETADELGINLHTLEGNLSYARYLYEKQGTKPWKSSKPCWGHTTEAIAVAFASK
jgi:hypothetical protein